MHTAGETRNDCFISYLFFFLRLDREEKKRNIKIPGTEQGFLNVGSGCQPLDCWGRQTKPNNLSKVSEDPMESKKLFIFKGLRIGGGGRAEKGGGGWVGTLGTLPSKSSN